MILLCWNLIQNKILFAVGGNIWIRLQSKISFVTSFTNFKRLKKYYFVIWRIPIPVINFEGLLIDSKSESVLCSTFLVCRAGEIMKNTPKKNIFRSLLFFTIGRAHLIITLAIVITYLIFVVDYFLLFSLSL